MSEVTRILAAIERAEPRATEQLLPLVYAELKQLAASQLRSERTGLSLSPTALVHEAYLRLVQEDEKTSWNSRGHFYSAAAIAMRRILVENARRRSAIKRGGGQVRVTLDEAQVGIEQDEELLALDEALTLLEAQLPAIAELVKLRYFSGLTLPQVAEVQEISLRTAERNWTYAKAWLLAAMAGEKKE